MSAVRATPGASAPPAARGLDAAIAVRRGGFELDVSLDVRPGRPLALVGPNGAGKSTLLLAIAGAVPIDAGRIAIDGAAVDDPATGAFTPVERRRVGMVFQDAVLLPHLSALENVAFGPRAAGLGRAAARATALAWLERFGLADRAALRPRELSGGESQRVALARALATEPAVLLLDEPLSSLDVAVRDAVRADLVEHLAGLDAAVVIVTHHRADLAAFGADVAVLEGGVITQRGSVAELAAAPATDFLARLLAS